jgi:hypothetical protein
MSADLAQRLVEAAAKQVMKDQPVLIHFDWSAEAVARPALVGAFRELCKTASPDLQRQFRELADSIEKGETA